jgi:serine phosphatase RsbU (regulator of sigma subunit)
MTRSTRKLGGDFIDFIRLSPDRFIFVIGDVSGKGLNASMSMVILKSVVRTFLKETKDFKKLVVKTNAFIKANLPRGTFFAGVFGLFDFKERSSITSTPAFPIMLLLSSAYNNPVEIQGDGKVLGFVKDIAPYVLVRKANFKPGHPAGDDGRPDGRGVRPRRKVRQGSNPKLALENRTASSERIVRYLSEAVGEFVSRK